MTSFMGSSCHFNPECSPRACKVKYAAHLFEKMMEKLELTLNAAGI